jgi:hypothetical protein
MQPEDRFGAEYYRIFATPHPWEGTFQPRPAMPAKFGGAQTFSDAAKPALTSFHAGPSVSTNVFDTPVNARDAVGRFAQRYGNAYDQQFTYDSRAYLGALKQSVSDDALQYFQETGRSEPT